MANQFAANPISCTTTMASAFKTSAGYNAQSSIAITEIIWNAPAAAGNTATITDGGNRTIFTYTATAADVTNGAVRIPFTPPIVTPDFQVTALTAGTLYIYIQ